MPTKLNYEEINEDKRKAELRKRGQVLKSLEKSEQQVSTFGDSKADQIQHLKQEITALSNSDRNISHEALYEMEVASLKSERAKLKEKLGRNRIDVSEEREWTTKLATVDQKIKKIAKQYTYLREQKPKDEISTKLDQLLNSGQQKIKYYGTENRITDDLLTKIASYQGKAPKYLYNELDTIVTEGQGELRKDVEQLSEIGLVKINNLDQSFEKITDNILSNAEKYKKNCVVMVNNFSQQNYVVMDALKDYGEHLKGNSMAKSASVTAIKFVSRLKKAVEAKQQKSKVEIPDKNDQKKDQTFYQEVPIPNNGQGKESFTQASNPSVSGRVSLVSNEFDARETSTDVVKEVASVKLPETKVRSREVKEQEAPSKRRDTLYAKVNGQVIKDETGQSKNDKKIFALNNSITSMKEELGKVEAKRKVFTDRGKTLVGRIRNFFSKGTIKQLDHTISFCKGQLVNKQNELVQLQNSTAKSKEKSQQSFEQVTDRSKGISQDRSKTQGKARNKKEKVPELA